jgi:8-oxo-dGTP pyrophosphatase MutT (NUDIX family)
MTDRDRRPEWLQPVLARVRQAPPHDRRPGERSAERPAAVLVLLIDSPTGPLLLLTERAPKLTNDPGTLVFPGGAVEPSDDGPVATALREAAEEVGIDPGTVHIIGLLPPLALPTTGFLVTAVVGWCAQLELTGDVNSDEVTAVVQVPLHEFAGTSNRVQRLVEAGNAATPALSVDGTAVGTMTATVIDLLFDRP